MSEETYLLVIHFDLESWQAAIKSLWEEIGKLAQKYQDAIKRLADEVKSALDSLAESIAPTPKTRTSNKQQFIVYRQAQQHHAQQQLQKHQTKTITNNRYWIKHKRRH